MAQKEKLKKFLPVVKIAVSVLFLTYIIKKMDLDNPEKLNNFKNILLGINPGHLIAGFIVMVVIVFLGAYRWRLFLLPQGIDINLGKAFEYTLIGFFFNNFFPSTVGGDIAKGVIVGRSSKKGIGTAVSIIMDRLIGMLAMGAMAIFALLISFNLPLDTRIRIMVIVFVFMVLVFQYLIFHKNFARKAAGILNKCRLRIIAEKIISVSDAFYTYRTKSKVMKKVKAKGKAVKVVKAKKGTKDAKSKTHSGEDYTGHKGDISKSKGKDVKKDNKKVDYSKKETKTKEWNGLGELPNFAKTDNIGLFKIAWEKKGFKVVDKTKKAVDYSKKTLPQLKAILKQRKEKGYSKLKKADLIHIYFD